MRFDPARALPCVLESRMDGGRCCGSKVLHAGNAKDGSKLVQR